MNDILITKYEKTKGFDNKTFYKTIFEIKIENIIIRLKLDSNINNGEYINIGLYKSETFSYAIVETKLIHYNKYNYNGYIKDDYDINKPLFDIVNDDLPSKTFRILTYSFHKDYKLWSSKLPDDIIKILLRNKKISKLKDKMK